MDCLLNVAKGLENVRKNSILHCIYKLIRKACFAHDAAYSDS